MSQNNLQAGESQKLTKKHLHINFALDNYLLKNPCLGENDD